MNNDNMTSTVETCHVDDVWFLKEGKNVILKGLVYFFDLLLT